MYGSGNTLPAVAPIGWQSRCQRGQAGRWESRTAEAQLALSEAEGSSAPCPCCGAGGKLLPYELACAVLAAQPGITDPVRNMTLPQARSP